MSMRNVCSDNSYLTLKIKINNDNDMIAIIQRGNKRKLEKFSIKVIFTRQFLSVSHTVLERFLSSLLHL